MSSVMNIHNLNAKLHEMLRHKSGVDKRFDMEIGNIGFLEFRNDLDDISLSLI